MKATGGVEQAAAQAAAATALCEGLRARIGERVVGQARPIEQLLVALLAGGHALLVGAPGLAKTLLVRTLGELTSASFRRIQFTPDLMPADIVGAEMMALGTPAVPALQFAPGPVFANLLLADEINRTPPKTQAALLECMQEGAVTVGGQSHALPKPFHVFATQNPLEQEGTYPLPEAQLDRFMLHISLDYPSRAAEVAMAQQATMELADGQRGRSAAAPTAPLPPPVAIAALLAAQQVVPLVPIAAPLLEAAVTLVRSTRPHQAGTPKAVDQHLSFGAGPRATNFLLRASQARAIVCGRQAVAAEDLRELAAPVLRHRLLLSTDGQLAAGEAPAAFVDALIASLLPALLCD